MVKLYLKLLFGISLLTATTTLVSAADLKEVKSGELTTTPLPVKK